MLILVLCLQLHLQFVQKINWDEFFYLSHIYSYQDGRLGKVLQMAHVHIFGWLTHLPGNEISQIRIGRLVMWGLQLVTLGLIIRIGQAVMSLTAGLFAALSFISLAFVFIHGTNFRADPLAACLMTYLVYVFAVSELRRADLLGLSCALGLAVLVTIKAVLFAPVLAVLALWRLISADKKFRRFLEFTLAALGAFAIFGLGYWWQGAQLSIVDGSDSPRNLANTFDTLFKSEGLFPRRQVMIDALKSDSIGVFLIVVGFTMAIWTAIMRPALRRKSLVCLALALPLLSFVFYRNAYPYFYAFIMPSVMLLAGYAVERLRLSNMIIGFIGAILVASTGVQYVLRLAQNQDIQVQTLEVIHDIFPEPVKYFDRNGFVSSFPKTGFFMSSWGIRSYIKKGEPVFVQEMQHNTVPLLIDNSPHISAALKGEPSELMSSDAQALRDNYIPHWGHIWVAGKRLVAGPESQRFMMNIPGEYTIESHRPVTINGHIYTSESVIYLTRGSHSYESDSQEIVTLRWGHHLKRPIEIPLPGPIFKGF